MVNSPITIGVGDSAAVVNVMTTSVSGSANMTAYTNSLSSGYASAAVIIRTVTPSPSTIGAYLMSNDFSPSPFQNSTNLVLQLQDGGGNPAKARAPTTLTITSSDASVYNGTLQVQIPQGSSYTVVRLVPHASGSTTLTITSPGLQTAAAQLQVLSSPLSVQISLASLALTAGQVTVVTLTASMDGVGVANVKVGWSASGGIISPPSTTTNAEGQAAATFKPLTAGVATIAASASFSHGPPQAASTAVLISASSSGNQGLVGTLLSFPYVLVLVGGIAAAVIIAVLLVRRRRGGQAEEAVSGDEGFNFYRTGRRLDLGVG
jgi:hypothetical protein